MCWGLCVPEVRFWVMEIDRLVKETEKKIGKPIVLRGIQSPDREWRGHIAQRPGYVLIEYRDDMAGYFWHYDIIRQLVALVASGRRNIAVYEGGIQFPDILRESID